ncbi:MAG: hypothetical protein JXA18_06705, partial [Chitinispirillaceae bacterium]|nr:hypothetical protein [Chitinispirillaceae bacterium]
MPIKPPALFSLILLLLTVCAKKVTTVAPDASGMESIPSATTAVGDAAPGRVEGESSGPLPEGAESGPVDREAYGTSPQSRESEPDLKIEPLKKEMKRLEASDKSPPPATVTAALSGKKAKKSKSEAAAEAGHPAVPAPAGDKAKAHVRARPAAVLTGAAAAAVKAASHDDNEEIVSYRDFCKNAGDGVSPYPWDVSPRYIIKLTYSDSSTAWNHSIAVVDNNGTTLFSGRTPASGEIVLLPKIDLGEHYGEIEQCRLSIDEGAPQPIKKGFGDLLTVTLAGQRQVPDALTLQICFLMDCTGSMSDEIAQLQDVIFSIHSRIAALPARPRVQFSIV